MSSEILEDRCTDAALDEVLRGITPPDLLARVVSASAQERQAAVRAVRAAGTSPRVESWRRSLLAAAIALLGATVVFIVWSTQRPAEPRAVDRPFEDDVQDPQRVVPETSEQFLEMLGMVERARARACYMRTRSGDAFVTVDLDRGTTNYIELPPDRLAELTAALRTLARGRTVEPRADFLPGVRIVLELNDGRTVHVLGEGGSTARVLADHDFPITRHAPLFSAVGSSLIADSSTLAQVELGLVIGGLDTRVDVAGKTEFHLPSTLASLECFDLDPRDLTHGIGRFENLRALDLTHSANTLAPGALRRERFTPQAQRALGNLRQFRARGLQLDDAQIATLLSFMPALEQLDLGGCESIGPLTLAHVFASETLRAIDLRGIKVTKNALLDAAEAARLPHDAVVTLTAGAALTANERAALAERLPCRLMWVD